MLAVLCANASYEAVTLDSCRAMALRNNKDLLTADLREKTARYEQMAAKTKYLPRISATGAYARTSKEISLLSDEQKTMLNTIEGYGPALVDALHTDTRNMGGAAVMLTQPVYMGGKIAAYNRITKFAERIAAEKGRLARQDIIVEVDEAYWKIVALKSKRRLADSYLKLVEKLHDDVRQMIEAGIATKADGLSVSVKVNEARVSIIQIDNGLDLSRMLLCQLCGLPLDTDITVADENGSQRQMPLVADHPDIEKAMALRPELNALSLAADISREKVKVTRAEYLPSVAITGGYAASYPSLFNSFERKMKGMWIVGVAVNIPIVTFGERIYKVRAAENDARIARIELEETREKVELQVSQCHHKMTEAQERLKAANSSLDEADENLRHATLGMREGVIPVSNVLEAQTAWVKAHSTKVDAEIDMLLADVYLRKAQGETIR